MLKNILYFLNNRYYNINVNCTGRSVNMAILNYQLSVFGNYSVLPTPETVTVLMNAINQATGELFLPNLISGQQVELPTNRITTISNLGYITQNQKFNIAILNERIDVTYNRIDSDDMSLTDFYEFAANALGAIMQNQNLRARRLAINIQAITNNMSEEDVSDLGKQLIKCAAYYEDKPFVEWSTRVNSESSIQLGGAEEKLNTIVEISTVKSMPLQLPALIYHLDINSMPQKTDLRFSSTSLIEFVNAVKPIVGNVLSDVERLISVD